MMRTRVGIVGAGPAGLLLSHLLHLDGIDSIVVEARERSEVEETIRAGVLEQTTVDLLDQVGLGARMRREGAVHTGFALRFGGRDHRIDLPAHAGGRAIMVYPQHEVLKDLIAARLATGATILFGARDVAIEDITQARPAIHLTVGGRRETVSCEMLAGCDGFHGICRAAMPATARHDYSRVYPFGWFGILCHAPRQAEELVYANTDRGFVLLSTRSPTVQRLYFQCDPADHVDAWPEDRIWSEFRARLDTDDFRVEAGPIFQKNIVQVRSFVCEPMQHGRLFLAGDAAHTVPPTGAKGLNLAVADVFVLARAMSMFLRTGESTALEDYSATALRRVWRAQHFSWWMTAMLHLFPDASAFDRRRQLAELDLVTSFAPATATLAENYVGWKLG
jgi:p-hydroxybenzoate 3-monooxygenase